MLPVNLSRQPPTLNIHTMEESSLEQRPVSPGAIFGQVRREGVPAGLAPPAKGITLLNSKVAQSRREWLLLAKDPSPLQHEAGQQREPGVEPPVYGTLMNA